ncbi:MAG: hypothetical protein IGR93_02965 [Hydrococcus sp. C42_A2020_068]|uniref:hypothetical protein n=1 Tax=Pleurocapsa sp. PCC 7327 TaxID=118163 RepID=UPI00029FF3B4|nr:hypothetical protein [Pleurocapsa sp. PCC 7327]AFY77674.1 hypothetical protein Ple7327_2367 [Pleurocapsa sp. PCC 7327]MBF2019089.1 hypothetical protein [Hydrococcus sp. C42_A2020_068]
MTQRLKRWESPRRQGRNDKGKGGSARQRQLKKQQQMLRKKLKENSQAKQPNQQGGREINLFPLIFCRAIAFYFFILSSNLAQLAIRAHERLV